MESAKVALYMVSANSKSSSKAIYLYHDQRAKKNMWGQRVSGQKQKVFQLFIREVQAEAGDINQKIV